MRVVAVNAEATPVARILNPIGEPGEPPRISPARCPPVRDDLPIEAIRDWDTLAQPPPLHQRVQW